MKANKNQTDKELYNKIKLQIVRDINSLWDYFDGKKKRILRESTQRLRKNKHSDNNTFLEGVTKKRFEFFLKAKTKNYGEI